MPPMRTTLALGILACLFARGAAAQPDPLVGDWRGTVKGAQVAASPIVITISKRGDAYGGFTSGLTDAAEGELALDRVALSGEQLSIHATADSKLGVVVLSGDLTRAGNTLKGPAALSVGSQSFEVQIELTRRPRPTIPQRQLEQRADYFVGRWKVDYVGGEFPPLSTGSRSGTIAFTRNGANFVSGRLDADLSGKPYTESHALGFDPETKALVDIERRSDGVELMHIGNWRSPLAIVFQTSAVQSGGKTYQLRRTIAITSDAAFEVTEEFSVDGGAFRRLGNAHYTKVP